MDTWSDLLVKKKHIYGQAEKSMELLWKKGGIGPVAVEKEQPKNSWGKHSPSHQH